MEKLIVLPHKSFYKCTPGDDAIIDGCSEISYLKCLPGYDLLKHECIDAVHYVDADLRNGQLITVDSLSKPYGCFISTYNDDELYASDGYSHNFNDKVIYFNTNSDGVSLYKEGIQTQPICKDMVCFHV